MGGLGGGNRRGPNIDAEPVQTGFERSLNGDFVRAALASDVPIAFKPKRCRLSGGAATDVGGWRGVAALMFQTPPAPSMLLGGLVHPPPLAPPTGLPLMSRGASLTPVIILRCQQNVAEPL